jgi:hypothetical protein
MGFAIDTYQAKPWCATHEFSGVGRAAGWVVNFTDSQSQCNRGGKGRRRKRESGKEEKNGRKMGMNY